MSEMNFASLARLAVQVLTGDADSYAASADEFGALDVSEFDLSDLDASHWAQFGINMDGDGGSVGPVSDNIATQNGGG